MTTPQTVQKDHVIEFNFKLMASDGKLLDASEDRPMAYIQGTNTMIPALENELNGKPDNIRDKILKGKMEKRFEEVCLLHQKFIKDDDKTVRDLLTELIAKVGEQIVVKRFRRFEIGSE